MTLETRLARIERQAGFADPYAHLSDEELATMIAALEASIEANVGMSISELRNAVTNADGPLPFGLTETDVRHLLAGDLK